MKADEVGCWHKVVGIVNYIMVGTKWLEKDKTQVDRLVTCFMDTVGKQAEEKR